MKACQPSLPPQERGVVGRGGLLEFALDHLSIRHKEGSTLELAGSQRRTWAQDFRCLEVSSCSSSWRMC